MMRTIHSDSLILYQIITSSGSESSNFTALSVHILNCVSFQMDNFRGLLSNLNLPLVDNFRQLQPLFGRRIFVRITSKNPKFKKTKLHYSKWDWVGHKKTENDVAEFDE